MKKPLLSIGIIFKNEIRCLERCLKSLRLLRDAIPCELVMADTGSDDGSREVAEQYADLVFNFTWINDFAAARNAVMDRCSGTWYMSIDCDEWVDPNIEGFVQFLTTDKTFDFASVIIRNYSTSRLDAEGGYSDFLASRLFRLSAGPRYEGAIHERVDSKGDMHSMMIRGAVFHHDGYVYQDKEAHKKKQERNMAPLREKLEHNPNDLIVLTQCIESGDGLPEQEDYLRRAMAGVDEKWSQWELFGPVIYRYAVRYGIGKNLPEVEEWFQTAEEKFPKSIFLRVEIACFAFGYYWNKDDYAKSIYWGEKYLQGVADYHAGNFDLTDLLASSLYKTEPHIKLSVATVLASGYLHEHQPEKCVVLMESLNGGEMSAKHVGDCVKNLCNLYENFGWDTDSMMLRLWYEINQPIPDQARADQRRTEFLQEGSGMFKGETGKTGEDTGRRAYMAFLPLKGKCSLGDAAVMLETAEPGALEELLQDVERWELLPIQTLAHALERGARFPLPEKPLNVEEMDALASRLTQTGDGFVPLALAAVERANRENWQDICWARGLLLAGVAAYPWADQGREEARGMALARAFAKIEGAYLPVCYAPGGLNREGLFLLPPLHRFGWYCAQAFDVLDAGDAAGYVRLLREGLERCEGVKDMVKFLIDHTPGLKGPADELKALAEQIRAVLAKFAPDDPAVAALKQSEAYQKVAYLIEGMEPPVEGGLLQ